MRYRGLCSRATSDVDVAQSYLKNLKAVHSQTNLGEITADSPAITPPSQPGPSGEDANAVAAHVIVNIMSHGAGRAAQRRLASVSRPLSAALVPR